jgi:CBS domain containing-hemolysin-like protein
VTRVGEQRQRIGEPAADYLDDQEDRRNGEGGAQTSDRCRVIGLAGRLPYAAIVRMRVPVGMPAPDMMRVVVVARPVRVKTTHRAAQCWRGRRGPAYLGPVIGRLFAIVVLLLFNGFFVAAEFALVRSRRTRLEAMARGGDSKAQLALRATGMLPRLLSASQLGITLASLGLGWVAESTLGEGLAHWFGSLPIAIEQSLRLTVGAIVALASVTYLHVVFGELAPRAVALNHPEQFARWLAPPLIVFAWLATPFIVILNRSSQAILSIFGQRGDVLDEPVHSPDELRLIVEQSQEGGAIPARDADLIEGVFEFSEKNAREVMTPRTEVVAMPVDATLEEALGIVEENAFSRYPAYDDSIDNIVGLVLAKDLLRVLRNPPSGFTIEMIMRDVHVVPGSREVEEVLADFKRLKEHMAVVLDEYGGTAGIVTMEDLLEEIVGEILDEHDEPEPPDRSQIGGETLVPGSLHIGEMNERFGLTIPDDDYTTIGGFVFGSLGRLPVAGDRVTAGGAALTVREMDGRRIETIAVDVPERARAL